MFILLLALIVVIIIASGRASRKIGWINQSAHNSRLFLYVWLGLSAVAKVLLLYSLVGSSPSNEAPLLLTICIPFFLIIDIVFVIFWQIWPADRSGRIIEIAGLSWYAVFVIMYYAINH